MCTLHVVGGEEIWLRRTDGMRVMPNLNIDRLMVGQRNQHDRVGMRVRTSQRHLVDTHVTVSPHCRINSHARTNPDRQVATCVRNSRRSRIDTIIEINLRAPGIPYDLRRQKYLRKKCRRIPHNSATRPPRDTLTTNHGNSPLPRMAMRWTAASQAPAPLETAREIHACLFTGARMAARRTAVRYLTERHLTNISHPSEAIAIERDVSQVTRSGDMEARNRAAGTRRHGASAHREAASNRGTAKPDTFAPTAASHGATECRTVRTHQKACNCRGEAPPRRTTIDRTNPTLQETMPVAPHDERRSKEFRPLSRVRHQTRISC